MGDDPPHRLGPGGVTSQGRAPDYREKNTAASGLELVTPSAGDGNAGSRIQRDGGVCSKELEYGRYIHRDATNSIPLRGDGVDARYMDRKKMMEKGGPGPGRSKGGGVGGIIRG